MCPTSRSARFRTNGTDARRRSTAIVRVAVSARATLAGAVVVCHDDVLVGGRWQTAAGTAA
jgi:hypothetical protein